MYSSEIKKNKPPIANVRIIPEMLEFINPFEGSTYKKTISIQNISGSSVFVRIGQPSSCAFKIKGICRSQYLSPGLKVVKTVTFTYTYLSPFVNKLPIFIDNSCYEYQMCIILPKPVIKYEPCCIDFGILDTGFTSARRYLHLRNDGSKATRFTIDVGKNDPQLIAEPHKGVLQPKVTTVINLTLIAFKEGDLMPEFWVICDTPIRVPVKGRVITPRIEVFHPNSTSIFTLLDFKTTYIGVHNLQPVIIRNFSSQRTMFCVMGVVNKEALAAEECNSSFKHFDVFPKEGRLEPEETRVIYFVYCPKMVSKNDKHKRYHFGGFQIRRVLCKDLDPNDYTGAIFKNECPPVQYNKGPSTISLITSLNASLDSDRANHFSMESYASAIMVPSEVSNSVIMVYLHGIPITASVEVVPDEIVISSMQCGQKENRVLKFKNMSKDLPVILRYKKVAFIDVQKSNAFLRPSEEMELLVTIAPHVIGTVKRRMKFDLMLYDSPKSNEEYKIIGHVTVPVVIHIVATTKHCVPKLNNQITPTYIKDVGMFCDDVGFNSHSVPKPKSAILNKHLASGSDLIAFPNCTQSSLRPWRSKQNCRTIFTGMSRYSPPCDSDYELTAIDQQLKNEINDYYMRYCRTEAERLRQLHGKCTRQPDDYDLSNKSLLLCTDIQYPKLQKFHAEKVSSGDSFIPLTPLELNEIIVSPHVIVTGKPYCFIFSDITCLAENWTIISRGSLTFNFAYKIVCIYVLNDITQVKTVTSKLTVFLPEPISAHHSYEFKVNLKNKSANAIQIFIKARQGCIGFPNGDRKIVKANSEINVNLIYLSQFVGFYTVSIDFIVNGNNVYVVTLVAEVVYKVLKLSTHHLEYEDDELYKYIDIYNPLNANIPFYWNIEQSSNFVVDPMLGIVDAKSHITCCITYLKCQPLASLTEIDFTSGDKINQTVQIISTDRTENCFFVNNEVKFENIPLNISVMRKAVLRNLSASPYVFRILNPSVLEGVCIHPPSATVKAHSEFILYVTAKMKACVKFSCIVKVEFTKSKAIELRLTGNVVYPEIKIVPCQSLLKRIPSSSFDSLNFVIENMSVADATISFDFSHRHEFKISASAEPWLPSLLNKITLLPKISMSLYLHFNPSDVSIGSFYLPIIINDLIGPPINTDMITTKVDYYISNFLGNSTSIKIPTSLECTTIQRRTVEPKIKFSKRLIKFKCAPWCKKSISSHTLSIVNLQKENDKMCIRTDELESNFQIKLVRGEPELLESRSIVCALKPKQEITFKISFESQNPGEYNAILPVFLKSDQSDNMHNYIHLIGIYPQPMILCEEAPVHFKPCILKATTTTLINLKMACHLGNCRLNATTIVSDLNLKLAEECLEKNKEGAMFDFKVEALYTPQSSTAFESSIDFTCTCGAQYNLPILGAAENCYLTNHVFVQTFFAQKITKKLFLPSFQSVESALQDETGVLDVSAMQVEAVFCMGDFFNSYPVFPSEPSSLSLYMSSITHIAESWVYSQGFLGTHFYSIPDGIRLIPDVSVEKRKNPAQEYWIMPFAQLLVNLVGDDMITYLKLGPPPDTYTKQVMYCYMVYRQAITFLEKLGALIPHVYPELLLHYTYFEHCVSSINTDYKGTIPDYRSFHYISKQAWLDLILQTYKVLMLQRLTCAPITDGSKTGDCLTPAQIFTQHELSGVKEVRLKSECIYTAQELMLLDWLEFNYNLMMKESWTKCKHFETKIINSFESNLDDGLVFIAVTTIHCPYLIPYMQHIYFEPTTSEHNFHNAVKIVQCWDMLNFSFRVTPQELVKSNAVQMLMLSSYLFEVLSHLHSTETITFEVGLSKNITKHVKLSNVNCFPIKYKVIFFNNDNECFSTSKPFVVIPPRKTIKIDVTYKAHFIRSTTTTMVLSGECIGFKYCKSKTLTLIGQPDVTHMTSTLTILTYLCKPTEVSITCVSPYSVAGVYQLQMTFKELKKIEDVTFPASSEDFSKILSKRFHPYKSQHSFDDSGKCNIDGLMCAMLPIDRTIWCYFHSKDVGDFAMQINTKLQFPKVQEKLEAVLPTACVINKPIVLKIPYQNNVLMDAFKTLLLKVKTGSDREFWKNHFFDISAVRLIEHIIKEEQSTSGLDIPRNFEKTVYSLKVEKNSNVILPTTLCIEDECDLGYQEIEVQFKKDCRRPKKFSFSLESADHTCFRYYTVTFVNK